MSEDVEIINGTVEKTQREAAEGEQLPTEIKETKSEELTPQESFPKLETAVEPYKRPLTSKQVLFISEYLKDFNATQAAIRSGYSQDTAGVIGAENLQKPYLREEINRQLDIILADNRQIAVRTIRELEKVAFSKLTDYIEYDSDKMTVKASHEIDSSALSQIEIQENQIKDKNDGEKQTSVKNVKIKLHDKVKALDLLAKYAELYKETLDVNISEKPLAAFIKNLRQQ